MKIRVLLENGTVDPALGVEHGLSLYIETNGKTILFDMGATDLYAHNADKLGIDLDKVDFAVLSHGHWDHAGGLTAFLERNHHAPVYVHQRAFEREGYLPDGRVVGVRPELENHPQIVKASGCTELAPGIFLNDCSGKEAEHPALTAPVPGGDPFADEHYLVVTEGEKRIVLSGCSHRGVLNVIEWLKPDTFVGGCHFKWMTEEGQIADGAQWLAEQNCDYYTGHCTGDWAFDQLHRRNERVHTLHTGQTLML